MITFSMDESGYTGYDLLHKEQKNSKARHQY
nr:hypothetical protein [Escherichia coli]